MSLRKYRNHYFEETDILNVIAYSASKASADMVCNAYTRHMIWI